MNYFVYMLFEKDYSSALDFISYSSVLDTLKNEQDLFVYLIYYWNSEWSPKIGNYLLSKDYKYDKNLSYYFYAIDEYSLDAVQWLELIGIPENEKYYDERFDRYSTPLDYAKDKLFEMKLYLGKDYVYTDNDEETKAVNKIIDYLKMD